MNLRLRLRIASVRSGSFTSLPPSRRVRFTPRADIRPMPAFMSTRSSKRIKNHRAAVPLRPCSVADRALALGIDGRVWWIGYLRDDFLPAHPLRRIARSRSSPPPHAAVGIFIVKNSRETMAARFCNRQFASPSAQAWDGVWRPAVSSRRRRLELGEAFIEGVRRDRAHVDIDHFGELRGL